MKTLSLKFRFAIVMSIGALLLVVGMEALSIHFAKQDLTATLSNQQQGLVTRAAEDLDSKLKLAMDSLSASAAAIPIDVVTSQSEFNAFYAQHPSLLLLFDRILILNARGVVTANYPQQDGFVGLDLSERRYFRRVMAEGKPVISEPVRGKVTGLPVVNVATPILDVDGRVTAVMVGVLSLTTRSLLGGLSSATFGATGYFAVVTTGPEPVFLAHPDAARIMHKVPVETSHAMSRVLNATRPGVGISTLEDRSKVLISYHPLAISNWILAAVLPSAEAFATIDHARQRAIRIGLLAVPLVLSLVWLFAWWLLRPLNLLETEVERIAVGDDRTALATVGRHDEVGQVAQAFNAMLTGQRRSEALRIASDQERRRLVAILESSEDFVAITDLDGHLTYLNASGRSCRGIALDDDLRDTKLGDHFPAWAVEKLHRVALPLALAKGVWLGETAVLAKDGREIPVDHTVIAHRNVDGELEFFSSLMHDTSAAQRAASAMRSSEARMLSIADALPVLVAFIDCDYRFRFVNSRYEDHFGSDRSKMIGVSVAELIGQVAFESYLPYLQRAALGETQVFDRESHAGVVPVHFLVKLIPQFDDDRQLIGYHFVHQDVTDHKVEHQRLSQLIHADALTGLLNRAGFEVAIDEAMQRSRVHLSTMALFYLDVDRFKSINDEHGHPVGDRLLRSFAGRLTKALRTADVAARLGGDEFVVIAEGLRSNEDVRSIAKKILREMRHEFEFGGLRLSITASIGVAVYAGDSMKAEELIKRADVALYRAKNAGRDRYDLDDPSRGLILASIESDQALELTEIV